MMVPSIMFTIDLGVLLAWTIVLQVTCGHCAEQEHAVLVERAHYVASGALLLRFFRARYLELF